MKQRPRGLLATAVMAAGVLIGTPAASASSDAPLHAQVVNGIDGSAADWPFVVQLAVGEPSGFSLECTGSLIAPGWVLTAAHCVSELGRGLDAARQLRVFAGGTTSFTGQSVAVTATYTSPGWNEEILTAQTDDETDVALVDLIARAASNDVGLVRLASPVSSTPVRLAAAADDGLTAPGRELTLVGWGSRTADDHPGVAAEFPDHLLRATLPVFDPTTVGVSPAQAALTVWTRGGHGSGCHGDSGGPLLAAGGDGYLRVVGVTSGGTSCAPSSPTGAAFARVSTQASWIRSVLGTTFDTGLVTAPTPASFNAPGQPTFANVTEVGRFTPTTPQRVLDTRTISQPLDGSPITAGQVKLSGMGSIPADAHAVLVNLTNVNSQEGQATVSPCGLDSYEMHAGLGYELNPVSWLTTIPLGPDGALCFQRFGQTDIVVDVLGWYGDNGLSSFVPADPTRIVDTRIGLGAARMRLAAGATMSINVPKAAAAAVNLTAIAGHRAGYTTAHSCAGGAVTSTVHVQPQQVHTALAVVPAADGRVCVTTTTTVDIVMDHLGSFVGGVEGSWSLIAPRSAYSDYGLDDSDPVGIDEIGDAPGTKRRPGPGPVDVRVSLTDAGLVPPDARVVILDVTALSPDRAGYVTVYPCDIPTPPTATANFARFDNGQENQVYVPLAADGSVCLHRSSPVALELTLFGWGR